MITLTIIPKPDEPMPTICHYDYLNNNGYCDDVSNTPVCGFDGGDCCGPYVQTMYCHDCLCLNGKGLCPYPFYKGIIIIDTYKQSHLSIRLIQ